MFEYPAMNKINPVFMLVFYICDVENHVCGVLLLNGVILCGMQQFTG